MTISNFPTGGLAHPAAFSRSSLSTYAILWLIPSFLAIWFIPVSASAFKLLLSLVFVVAWHAAFRSLRLAVLLSLPIFIYLPADILFFLTYHEPFSAHVIPSIVETNAGEASDFMRGRVFKVAALTVLCLGVWAAAYAATKRWNGPLFPWPWAVWPARLAVAFVWLCVVLVAFPTASEREDDCNDVKTLRCTFIMRVPLKMKGIFPVGRMFSVSEYLRENAIIRHQQANRGNEMAGLAWTPRVDGPETYVLVIGETGRRDRMGIHGYERDTNPRLKQRSGVIPLDDMITSWTLTTHSVPAMLSPVSAIEKPRTAKAALSLVSIFRAAGYKTYWISNQPTIGAAESTITRFSSEAHERYFPNPSTNAGFGNGTLDDALLPYLENVLDKRDERRLIVIHLLGSHDSYQRRHPESYERFRPSLRDADSANPDHHDVRLKTEINNSYDNSVLYTDYVLDEMIQRLSTRNGVTALIYAADHGETLFDGRCTESGHGGSSHEQYPIAAFAWLSDSFRSQRPEAAASFSRNARSRLTVRNLLPTMLDLGGISLPGIERSMSFASPGFRQTQRLVMAGSSVIDWDNSRVAGVCNEIFPK